MKCDRVGPNLQHIAICQHAPGLAGAVDKSTVAAARVSDDNSVANG